VDDLEDVRLLEVTSRRGLQRSLQLQFHSDKSDEPRGAAAPPPAAASVRVCEGIHTRNSFYAYLFKSLFSGRYKRILRFPGIHLARAPIDLASHSESSSMSQYMTDGHEPHRSRSSPHPRRQLPDLTVSGRVESSSTTIRQRNQNGATLSAAESTAATIAQASGPRPRTLSPQGYEAARRAERLERPPTISLL
jgi:hypothetical protein